MSSLGKKNSLASVLAFALSAAYFTLSTRPAGAADELQAVMSSAVTTVERQIQSDPSVSFRGRFQVGTASSEFVHSGPNSKMIVTQPGGSYEFYMIGDKSYLHNIPGSWMWSRIPTYSVTPSQSKRSSTVPSQETRLLSNQVIDGVTYARFSVKKSISDGAFGSTPARVITFVCRYPKESRKFVSCRGDGVFVQLDHFGDHSNVVALPADALNAKPL